MPKDVNNKRFPVQERDIIDTLDYCHRRAARDAQPLVTNRFSVDDQAAPDAPNSELQIALQ